MSLRVLLVHPGAAWATADVHDGLEKALRNAGCEVVSFALDNRLNVSAGYLMWIWKRANGKLEKPNPSDFLYHASSGILERALRHQVDWVFIVCHMYVHPDVLDMLQRAHLKVAILFTESPYDDRAQMAVASKANVVWVNERTSVERFKTVQPNSHYWRHAIDPEKHTGAPGERDDEVPEHDVVFVGTGFQERIDLLSAINWDGIDFGLYGSWTLLGSRHRLRKHMRGGVVPNEYTAGLYRRAKIGLNIHRTSMGWGKQVPRIEGAESMGPRCFELAACGLFFLSDYRAEMGDIFGGSVPTFRTAAEAEALIRAYLARPEERQAIAQRLPDMVRQETFAARVAEILPILQEAT